MEGPTASRTKTGMRRLCADAAKCIAQEGVPDALYNGALGDLVVRDIETHCGILPREDLQTLPHHTPGSRARQLSRT